MKVIYKISLRLLIENQSGPALNGAAAPAAQIQTDALKAASTPPGGVAPRCLMSLCPTPFMISGLCEVSK